VAPSGYIINRRFGGTCRFHLQGRRNNASKKSVGRLLTDWLLFCECTLKLKLKSVAWVQQLTIPTERPPLVREVTANFLRIELPRCQRDGSLRPYYPFSRPEPLLCLSNSSSIVLTMLIRPRSWPTVRKSGSARNLTRTCGSVVRTLTTRPQRRSFLS
jgi:hypothetical protein